MKPITITNENILLFYKENPSIDIVNINLVFIDILKQLSSNLSTTIGNTLTSQIYTIVSDIKTDVQKLGSSITIQLHDIKKEYTVIIVTHNMQQAARISDYTSFFIYGNLIEHGLSSDIFTNPKIKQTKDYISGRFG
jgi:hypothetical protein